MVLTFLEAGSPSLASESALQHHSHQEKEPFQGEKRRYGLLSRHFEARRTHGCRRPAGDSSAEGVQRLNIRTCLEKSNMPVSRKGRRHTCSFACEFELHSLQPPCRISSRSFWNSSRLIPSPRRSANPNPRPRLRLPKGGRHSSESTPTVPRSFLGL